MNPPKKIGCFQCQTPFSSKNISTFVTLIKINVHFRLSWSSEPLKSHLPMGQNGQKPIVSFSIPSSSISKRTAQKGNNYPPKKVPAGFETDKKSLSKPLNNAEKAAEILSQPMILIMARTYLQILPLKQINK